VRPAVIVVSNVLAPDLDLFSTSGVAAEKVCEAVMQGVIFDYEEQSPSSVLVAHTMLT
jgi:hypothetical protein